MVVNAIIAWLIPFIPVAALWWHFNKSEERLIDKEWMVVILCLLLVGTWLIPFGPIIPLLFMMGALNWGKLYSSSKKHRSIFVGISIVGILLTGFVPTSIPVGPQGWGEPLSKENPNSAIYPATEQHVWLLSEPELAAVSITTGRTPWALNPVLGEVAVLGLISITGADKARMQSSIEALNEGSSKVNIDPELFELVDIESESTHHYKRGDVDSVMHVKRQQIVMDIDLPLITLRADVLTVIQAEWGGEATILTIVRPGFGESNDIWAEDVVIEWLESLEE
ncbi:MAG: hypothetical protein ACKVHH_07210 [Candidatus Poseidoniales archaeon]|jgi:hypothetical protein|tara:strand:+ start:221 stop:1063 length:843 start_codon:yes stop_codon:yes gene_type:complete